MNAKKLYDTLFTEYPDPIGYAPAIVTLATCLVVCASLAYGGYTLGKPVFVHVFGIETTHS
jgi:hypothetical protein